MNQKTISLDDFKEAYIQTLIEMPEDYFMGEKPTVPSLVVDRMIKAISLGSYPSDWLKHNKAMRIACAKIGITKSRELRELIKSEVTK